MFKKLPFVLFLLSAAMTSCGGGGGGEPFQDPHRGNRRSAGNAEVEGPGAEDLIRQSRRDYYREKHQDRRYYGNY